MKKYKFFAALAAAAITFSSCSMDTEPYDQTTTPYTNLKGVETGLNGAYQILAYYPFLGNYAQTMGDFISGVSTGSSSSGHFYSYSSFTFSDTEQEIEDMWNYGYKAISQSTEAINSANSLIASGAISEEEKPTAYLYEGQLYTMKALANWYLVNYFALPYSAANASTPGIIVIDKDVPKPFAHVERGTVQQTYDQIVKDLDSAEVAFSKVGNKYKGDNSDELSTAYYLNPTALKAVEARVYLSLGKYDKAIEAAKASLALKDAGTGDSTDTKSPTDSATYVNIWGQVTESDEDIFTLKKSDNDNLSANSINTLYGSYYATIQNNVLAKLASTDIRRKVLRASAGGGTSSIKFDGKVSQSVSNVPVIRKSELSLIIAECEARLGNIKEAQNYLLYTARRNKAIKTAADLPQTTDGLLSFIADERLREFFGEGHRWFDARRMGLTIQLDGFNAWDISKFVLPIPAAEINSGAGCTQNANWSDNMPTRSE